MGTDYIKIFEKFMGTGLVVILFLAALLYLFFTEKKKPLRIIFLYLPIAVLLLYFNPLFYRLFYGVVESEIYFRILWLLPVTPVLAYAGISLYGKAGEKNKLPVLLGLLLLFPLCGKLMYSNPLFSWAENPYHVPDYVVEVCDAIEVDGREVMAVFPEEFLLYVRQYSPTVCMPYGRDALIYPIYKLHHIMESEVIDVASLVREAKAVPCHYIVLHRDKELDGDLLAYEYELFGEVNEYVIYRDTTVYIGL